MALRAQQFPDRVHGLDAVLGQQRPEAAGQLLHALRIGMERVRHQALLQPLAALDLQQQLLMTRPAFPAAAVGSLSCKDEYLEQPTKPIL